MIGFVIGQDMNMINCMHVKDAQNQCHKKPKKPEWMVKYRASQYCPKDDDPTLICEIVRWYPAVKHSHLIPFPGLYSFETFAMGRFKFNRTEMFKEAYQYYEKYHNNFDFPWGEWEADGMKGPTFGVPVCKNDHLYLHDMNPKTKEEKKKHSSQIGIGSMCGDSRGNETHLVFDAMNLAPGSELYQQHDKTDLIRHDNELYREHLPRVSLLCRLLLNPAHITSRTLMSTIFLLLRTTSLSAKPAFAIQNRETTTDSEAWVTCTSLKLKSTRTTNLSSIAPKT